METSTDGGEAHITITLGTSGKSHLEREWLIAALKTFSVFCRKQQDYGSENIQRHGLRGIAVRLDDKLARMTNLLKRVGPPANESLYDTVQDIADYGVIGMLVLEDNWS